MEIIDRNTMSKILIVDIETTGFSASKNKIVEIGIVELDLSNGNTEILFDELIHEDGLTRKELVNSWIIENSLSLGIIPVWEAKNLQFYFDTIQKILSFYPLGITAFNNQFDLRFLQRRGFTWYKTLPCLMERSTNICRIPGKNGGYKWPKVQEAYNYFFPGNDYVESHRGADDAKHEAQIAHELYKLGLL